MPLKLADLISKTVKVDKQRIGQEFFYMGWILFLRYFFQKTKKIEVVNNMYLTYDVIVKHMGKNY